MKTNTRKIVGIGLFTAIVVVLQMVASAIKFGTFSITLVLAPIIVGAALYGVGAGAWLGLVFGATVLISGDAAPFMAISAPGTIATVLVKGMCAGIGAGVTFKLLEKKNKIVASVCAGIVSPVCNTGVFFIGCYLFFQSFLTSVIGTTNFVTVVTALAGVNFLVELAINLFLASVIVKLVDLGRKQVKTK